MPGACGDVLEALGEALEGGDRMGDLGAVMVEEGLSSEAKALELRFASVVDAIPGLDREQGFEVSDSIH
jgi:hypothetical protein